MYHQLKYLPVDLLVPNHWNVQEQDEVIFNRLVDEIKEGGGAEGVTSETFIDTITVLAMDDGRYRIIGGEHRWMAAKAAGIEEVPCLILSGKRWEDEDYQKFVSIRLNVLKGKLNPEKFLDLYNSMVEKYGKEALQGLMGFVDSRAFDKLVDGVKKGMRKALSKDAAKEFDERAKDAKTAEDLAKIIQDLFNRYGDTLEFGFMVFTYGKQDHWYVQATKKVMKSLDQIALYCRETKAQIGEVLAPILDKGAKELAKKLAEEKKAVTSGADPLLDSKDPTDRS